MHFGSWYIYPSLCTFSSLLTQITCFRGFSKKKHPSAACTISNCTHLRSGLLHNIEKIQQMWEEISTFQFGNSKCTSYTDKLRITELKNQKAQSNLYVAKSHEKNYMFSTKLIQIFLKLVWNKTTLKGIKSVSQLEMYDYFILNLFHKGNIRDLSYDLLQTCWSEKLFYACIFQRNSWSLITKI